MHSVLTDSVHIAYSGNYQKGRNGQKVCKITPHQMAGKLTGTQCAVNIFGKKGRKASANYCIGYNGDIVCNVEEEDRAYTSLSAWNDNRAITIEISNSANGTDRITEASWESLLDLCEDICRRYNFKLEYTGTKEGSLTLHQFYANTNCPGNYIKSKIPELVRIVNARLEGKEDNGEESFEMSKTYRNGSTSESIFCDSNLSKKIGALSPYEICECLGIYEGRAVVKYKVSGTNNYKVGFAKYIPKGLQ